MYNNFMEHKLLKLLLVEDDQNFGLSISKFLARARRVFFTVEQVFTLQEGLSRLSSATFDVVLLDLTLPDSQGIESVNLILEMNLRIPIIVLTGEDEALAIEALHLGVQDYIQKGDFDLRALERIILYAVERQELMTRVKDQRDLLNQRAADLETSNARFASLGYTLAHDLSEPLRTISSYLHLLRKKSLDRLTEKELEYLDMATSGSQRMALLIKDLYEYSQIDGKSQFVSVDLNLVISEVLVNLRKAVEDSQAEILMDTLPVVMGCKSQLIMLFQNLISNSLRYKKPDLKTIIKIEALESQNEFLISVSDNGIGINSKFLNEIFEPFRRLHSMDDYPGSGIGLASCKRIMEYHQGRIWAQSEIASGSNFYVAFPPKE